jgi:hypothetical protein
MQKKDKSDYMSEIGELHEKVNDVRASLSELTGYIKGTIPSLATKADIQARVVDAIEKHAGTCKRGVDAKLIVGIIAAVFAGIGGLVTAIFKG